ncbi:heme-binding domain-containing protein [Olivibacter sp. SDN3]|uniref:heme-binding domain-containing protein n=1 Tax=unclassified Olivibacter TaxID=2632301 RepID=UPI00165183D4|nr:heme-binding domain-containing protein [Olivibacter sp. SDN3]MDX3916867.1 heme-binding domain-containing protein [Pseudosphingobacterium sp.]QNL50321.1 heme-binding domain-containing protein [Olivibacter sp. SDN3]
MNKLSKSVVVIGIFVLLAVVIIQFIPKQEKNNGAAGVNAINHIYNVPQRVNAVLKKACLDCHSNRTAYPWYSSVQPFAKLMENHIIHGKKELNLDEFGSYPIKKQYNKLRSIESQLKDGAMPLKSYTLIHRDARLTKEEVDLLINWSKGLRNKIDAKL